MMNKDSNLTAVDGNTAVAHVAYAFSEVAAIYPITPSSPMGELSDAWSAKGRKNIFGEELSVVQMQSEAGVAGAVHGSLSAGAMTTTFTSSQGLMLMIPNMFKIAGELLPTVFHVAARSLACQSLSIFGDHSDVMTVRNTGFALLASSSIQETHDMAVISHLATLESRIPFVHFFDGLRTSHEIQKAELASYDLLKSFLDKKYVDEFRDLQLNPDSPFLKVAAQNPDIYFQGRESTNKFYEESVGVVKKYMKLFAEKTGRKYQLFDYIGDPQAEKIIVSMCSSCETIEEAVEYLQRRGEKVGAIKVRLYRPFSVEDFIAALPRSVTKIAVLDRCKEPGSIGEPLYLDIVAALKGRPIEIIGGRYGLSSKEFTPSMVKAVYKHLEGERRHDFTVGITDDVTYKSIPVEEEIDSEDENTVKCKFWGFGSDGTVGANKNAIKIIGENTNLHVQGYFEYDSKKSGGLTISHLRFGKKKIRSIYLLKTCDFIALHNHSYIGKYDILSGIKEEGTFLLNSPWDPKEAFHCLSRDMQEIIINKKIKFYTIDANKIARESGLGNRINTTMAIAFFKLSHILPENEALDLFRKAIEKTFRKKGEDIVKKNFLCLERSLEALFLVETPKIIERSASEKKMFVDSPLPFIKDVLVPVIQLKGNDVPVSKVPVDGRIPTNTSKLEKRAIAQEVPKWKPETCSQCGICTVACPHAVIRAKQIDPKDLKDAPKTFETCKAFSKNASDLQYRLQIYIEDCTGCRNCVEVCPIAEERKPLKMHPFEEAVKDGEIENTAFFEKLPESRLDGVREKTIKEVSLKPPFFEFSGACAGCGETPYIKMLTQLFGERMIVANATGCSSIYGGTFPTTPYCTNKEGKGPAWANSLFEDNAEFGFGMRLAVDVNRKKLQCNIKRLLQEEIGGDLSILLENSLERWNDSCEKTKENAKKVKGLLKASLEKASLQTASIIRETIELQDFLIDRSVWLIGGDGWAYDIGYGGLDHVMATDKNINVLVLDTESYSNTGGQASKSTPRGAVAPFASSGKKQRKKNLGMMIACTENAYVASVNIGANRAQTLKAILEAEKYPGPSIVIAYSPCIAHGIDMEKSPIEGKLASDVAYWPLYRYNPMLIAEGKNPLVWDSKEKSHGFDEYLSNETRYRTLRDSHPEEASRLQALAEDDNEHRYDVLKSLSSGENTK